MSGQKHMMSKVVVLGHKATTTTSRIDGVALAALPGELLPVHGIVGAEKDLTLGEVALLLLVVTMIGEVPLGGLGPLRLDGNDT